MKIIANELSEQVENYRLQNIYDLSTSSRQFLFKFAIPDSKKLVVVDPGYRIHGTDYARSTAQTPSGFVAKLRKHLRTRRLNKIRIAPQNRLLAFSFSDEHSFHLVFEFFAGGNMLLLDKDFKILSLQRVVSASDTKTRCAVGEIYPLQEYLNAANTSIKEFSSAVIRSWLQGEGDEATYDNENEDKRDQENPLQQGQPTNKGIGQKKRSLTLKKLLFVKAPGIATGLIESALVSREIDPNIKSTDTEKLSFSDIAEAMNEAKTKSDELVANTPVKGFILGKLNPKFDQEKYEKQQKVVQAPEVNAIDPHNIEYLYEEFQPFEPRIPDQDSEKYKLIETQSYTQAVDIYFSTIEATKLALKTANQEQVAEKRLNAAKAEKDKRVQGLTEVQEKSELLGTVLEMNAYLVEEAANAVKGLIQQGMDWKDIEKLIQVEKSRNNPVAEIIHLPLNLIKNKISVVLPEPGQVDDGDDEDGEKVKKVKVEIDLGLSAWANASSYFDVKKTAAAKQERTIKQADHAYKNAEKKIKKDLQQALDKEKNQQTMHSIREPFWFEKFFWFLSSDGYLVLGGRDSMQNELLFRRHFKQNDIYVHSEVEGTCVVIIKNHISGSKVVPPGTLSQAGALCLASSSKVWESKMNPSAWWATRDQIPKISQGDIVTTDRVVVKGEGKHHLPPTQMDMGFGFLWLVGEEAKENYSKNVPEGLISAPGEESKQDAGSLEEESTLPTSRQQEQGGGDSSPQKEEVNEEESSDDEEFPDTQIPDEEDQESKDQPKEEEEQQNESSVEPESTRSSTPEAKTGNRKLSAKERRDLKKKKKNGGAGENGDDASSSSAAVQDIEKTLENLKMDSTKGGSKKEKAGGGEQKPPKVRGKKGKMKKIATKYADQDEEDRQKRMELLGTTKGLERARAQAEEEKRKKQEYERQRKEKERRRKEAEMRRLQDEENDETPETVFPFNTLVPRLVPGDTPLGAVPVFGPWSSLQKLKYKVKLQPGSTKKGKAVREMLHFFSNQKVDQEEQDSESPWQSEVDLISTLKESELLLPIAVSKVKPVLPGSANKSNQKSKGKGKK
ncbi:hypothetical protein TRICI_006009 [Trichomonascus ciferrii]|uniref:Ribosome quality control complex subunit 2 n=1 Tax=Trichomonascus ciferrii TaxID=44093 RepID=A0A642UML6_9ASCO|nr:hypothetical protein TRICI_006009 [Trichomonascus ciferrii]